jgi:hypothetical protein
MKPRVLFPIRWRLLIPVLAICAGSGYVGYTFLQRAWAQEYEKLLVEFSLKRLRSVSEQMESRLTQRYRELENICQKAYRLHKLKISTAATVFDSATPEIRKDLLGISFFRPEASGKVSYFHYVHWKLIAQKNLPRDIVDQINGKYPVNIRKLLSERETVFFNRSVLDEHGEPISVVTLAFFGKSMDDMQSPTLILADMRGDFLSKQENPGQLGEVFWMKQDGTVLAHPSAALAYRYAEQPMPHQARPLMESATAFGEHLRWVREGNPYLASVAPTAIDGVYAVSEVPVGTIYAPMHNLTLGIGVAFFGLVSGLCWFLAYVSGRLTGRVRSIEMALRELAQGYAPSRRLRYFDEFSAISNALQELVVKVTSTSNGFTQSQTAKEPHITELRLTEVLQVETTQIAFYQPPSTARNPATLWDVSRLGNRMWFLLGSAGGDPQMSSALIQNTKKALPGLRTAKGTKDSVELADQVGQLNRNLFEAFSGKAWLNLTAVELHLDSGKLFVVNAANEAPLMIPSKLQPSPQGTAGSDSIALTEPKGLNTESAAVGSRGDNAFKVWEGQLQARDAFCLFQKDTHAAEGGPISFRPEIRNLIQRYGCQSAKELRFKILTSTSKEKLQGSLMLGLVHFGAASSGAEKPATNPNTSAKAA